MYAFNFEQLSKSNETLLFIGKKLYTLMLLYSFRRIFTPYELFRFVSLVSDRHRSCWSILSSFRREDFLKKISEAERQIVIVFIVGFTDIIKAETESYYSNIMVNRKNEKMVNSKNKKNNVKDERTSRAWRMHYNFQY